MLWQKFVHTFGSVSFNWAWSQPMVSTGAIICERISLIASYASRHLGGAGWGVFKDCGIGFGCRGELEFACNFCLIEPCDGVRCCSEIVSSMSGIALEVISFNLTRFERRGVDRPDPSSASNSVTEEWKGLGCTVSLVALDALLFIRASTVDTSKYVMWRCQEYPEKGICN